MHLKKPDLTETYPAFILSEGKIDHLFVGKICSKLDITLETPSIITNLIMLFFLMTTGCILEID